MGLDSVNLYLALHLKNPLENTTTGDDSSLIYSSIF